MVGTSGPDITNVFAVLQMPTYHILLQPFVSRKVTYLYVSVRHFGVVIGVVWRSRSDLLVLEIITQACKLSLFQILGHVAINIHRRAYVRVS